MNLTEEEIVLGNPLWRGKNISRLRTIRIRTLGSISILLIRGKKYLMVSKVGASLNIATQKKIDIRKTSYDSRACMFKIINKLLKNLFKRKFSILDRKLFLLNRNYLY
jgi:hypothetical protein